MSNTHSTPDRLADRVRLASAAADSFYARGEPREASERARRAIEEVEATRDASHEARELALSLRHRMSTYAAAIEAKAARSAARGAQARSAERELRPLSPPNDPIARSLV